MQLFAFSVLIWGNNAAPGLRRYEVRAADEEMARAMCRAQCAINGWSVLGIERAA